jgi:uncharacterized protein YceH (UPF0502 family)
MKVELSPEEARVIGALIEKQVTTPDQYPLSLNALTNACNQKSNREPVMNLDERAVQRLLDGLSKRALVVDRSGFGSRVPKYRHLFCNTEFGSRKFAAPELAVGKSLTMSPDSSRDRAERDDLVASRSLIAPPGSNHRAPAPRRQAAKASPLPLIHLFAAITSKTRPDRIR